MHRLLRLLLVPVTVLGLLAQDAPMKTDANQQTGRLRKRVTQLVNLEYLLFLPAGVKEDPGKQWPLLFFLHGAGERGTNVWQVAVHGPPKIVREKKDFPFIVVSPQCPAGETWSNDALLALLDTIIAKYPVDRTRVYLTGLSMGGFGTWSLVEQYPNTFAAIAPVSGGGNPYRARELKHIPVMIFHGQNDKNVPVWQAQQMAMSLVQAGGDAKLMVYPNAGHNIWDHVYSRQQLYEWFLEHVKPQQPAETEK